MFLPVQSLASLASRAVLTHQLDTRDLPLQLHQQMEQYRRSCGAFTLLSMDLELERLDGGEVSEEQWKNEVMRFVQSDRGQAYTKYDVVFTKPGKSKGTLTKVGPKTTTLHLQNPAEVLHKNGIDRTNTHRTLLANYLENGKVMCLGIKERAQLNQGQLEVEEVTTVSTVVDPTGRLTRVERLEEPLEGLVRTFTTRGTRAQRPGNTAISVGSQEWRGEEEFIDPALLDRKYNPKYKTLKSMKNNH